MPFDAVFMSCLRSEIEDRTAGNKIDRVQQPERDVIILTMKGAKLLISLNASSGRVQITEENFENPMTPPMFCMLLRKHLTGGRILSVTQPPFERVFDFEIEVYDALGALKTRHLIAELMGRYTNLILTDEEMIIIDCIRRIGFDISDKRQVLPGLKYRLPPKTGKRSPLETGREEFINLLSDAGDVRLDKWLNSTFDGLSPLICREIVYRAYGSVDIRAGEAKSSGGFSPFYEAFFGLMDEIVKEKTSPYILTDADGRPFDYSYTEIKQYEGLYTITGCETYSQLLGEFYSKRDRIERMRVKTQSVSRNIRRLRDRTERKVAAQKEELLLTRDRDRNRENGDLITSNIYKMKKGMTVLVAEDYYSPEGGVREIKLDPLKTPQQNAAKYYKDYTKAKTAEIHLNEQIAKGEGEIEYLDSVLDELERAETEKDVAEIRQELTDLGYIRASKTSKREKRVEQKPMRFISTSGAEILVGKNNTQNDRLTLKTAFKNDIWLHTQKIHGSHVVISTAGGEPDENTIYEAAVLAAVYSQAKDGSNVPVDYTRVRYVKKPSGAKPGMVIYTDYKTVYVNPDESLAEKLRAK